MSTFPARANGVRYATDEFHSWAERRELFPSEEFLLSRYLDPSKRTVEAGSGGGCILLNLHERGFEHLAGFDVVPRLVERARQRDASRRIDFSVQDAVALTYPDRHFEQAIYLQQVLCFIDDRGERRRALHEANRILEPGGTALFSFLCFDWRSRRIPHRAYLAYLRSLRRLLGDDTDIQLQPWLRKRRRLSFDALLDRGARVYWYRLSEMQESLRGAGFDIVAAGSARQLEQGRMYSGCGELTPAQVAGSVYFVCVKVRDVTPAAELVAARLDDVSAGEVSGAGGLRGGAGCCPDVP